MKIWAISLAFVLSSGIHAAQIKTLKREKRARFVETSQGIFQPMDRSEIKVKFSPVDFSRCGRDMKRTLKSLKYSCKVELPRTSTKDTLEGMISPTKARIKFGRTEKLVEIRVSSDVRFVTYSISFDDTGLDYELGRFNDEFFGVYAKVAALVIQEAMNKHPLRLKVIEDKG